MSDRRLFYAYDAQGKKVLIDRLSSYEAVFFCPFCKAEVIPKMGDERVWHFAHKGDLCASLRKNSHADKDRTLQGFQTAESATLDVGDSVTYLCRICRTVGRKESGVHLHGKVYVCKECFAHAPPSSIQSLR